MTRSMANSSFRGFIVGMLVACFCMNATAQGLSATDVANVKNAVDDYLVKNLSFYQKSWSTHEIFT